MIKLNYNKPTLFKDLRYENRLTAKEFAAKISVTSGAYHHLEHGNVWPSFGTVLKTMEVFSVDFQRFAEYFTEREDFISRHSLKKDRRAGSKEARSAK